MPAPAKEPIILFDGVCHLCAGAVQFILKRDPKAIFRFAPLQSPLGIELRQQHHLDSTTVDTLVLIENGNAYTRSSAALHIAKQLNAAWPLCYAAIIIPRPLRDAAYNFIARNRYRWFGKSEACMMPQPGWKERFL
ncbi:thiol-disulfide oxidoreductase DCC family protein [Phragmitibacter flavus]|uniref:Thiol-disulfide oxidoreductase DCC family protein n=1 Tax=Phragmitibacter flavus TaxID=2576071 RepID=A0A5R8KI02_9BACT|nr:thiol-disulfide oxidoreductase DCC family protein [Phragmitibacter flavus]TLD71956.1 thiol-disulfide oxidoreductase DCC family protein [Phragmitibacter flavus]